MYKQHYGHLAIMTLLSFIAMFILMYAMVERKGSGRDRHR